MKVLLAASEVAPIIKLGGLGDVIGSLPKALQKEGVNIDVIVPYYPIADVSNSKIYKALELNIPFDGDNHPLEVFKTKLPDSSVDVFLLRNSRFFSMGGQSAFADSISETEMFSFFNRAVVEFIKSQFNTYDLVHCNDWHTGLITHLLKDELSETRPATLFTIHNIMYQGIGDVELAEKIGFVPGQHPLVDWDLEDGDINLMLQGITSSDYINTVSSTYAHEIVTEKFGGGFADILRNRSGRLSGILNGLDYSMFPRYYDVHNAVEGKLEAKKTLAEKLDLNLVKQSLEDDFEIPVFGFIGRLDPGQKGLDILFDFLSNSDIDALIESSVAKISTTASLTAKDSKKDKDTSKVNKEENSNNTLPCQFVILGKGDPSWEKKFKDLGAGREDIQVEVVFDVELARQIYAGSDFLLVPSSYEPCGLIQLISMWYGTLPIVNGVGGLKDSVTDGVTGLILDDYSTEGLEDSFKKALRIFRDKSRLENMITNAMNEDFGWERSAKKYKKLYERAIKMRRLISD